MRPAIGLMLLAAVGHADPGEKAKPPWDPILRAVRWLEQQQDQASGLFAVRHGRAHSIATTALVLDALMECGWTRRSRFSPAASRILHLGIYGLARAQPESGLYSEKGPTTYPDVLATMVLVRDRVRPDPRIKKHVVRSRQALRRAQRTDGSWGPTGQLVGDPVLTALSVNVLRRDAKRAGPYLKSFFRETPAVVGVPEDAGPAALLLPRSNQARLAATISGLLHLDPDAALKLQHRFMRTWLAAHPLGSTRDDPAHAYWIVRHLAPAETVAQRSWLRTLRKTLVETQQENGCWHYPRQSETASTAMALWCLAHPMWYSNRGRYVLYPPRPPK